VIVSHLLPPISFFTKRRNGGMIAVAVMPRNSGYLSGALRLYVFVCPRNNRVYESRAAGGMVAVRERW